MAVILFVNLGYAHEQFPAFLKACDDVRAGVDSPEVRWFCWSETGQDQMDVAGTAFLERRAWQLALERTRSEIFLGQVGRRTGRLSPAAVQLRGPRLAGGDPPHYRFLAKTGIDGMVIDAVNWYVDCNWEITRYSMTDLINRSR
jgi:hypothetical protein